MTDIDYSGVEKKAPCPCGSGLKFKRCHGRTASSQPATANPFASAAMPGLGQAGAPFDPSQMDPEWLNQVTNAMKRLPRGQMMRMQQLMQKAMKGQDVSAEAESLEKILPPELQNLLKNAAIPSGLGESPDLEQNLDSVDPENMTEEQAREILRQAEATGAIPNTESGSTSGLGKFWKKFKGK